MTQANENANGSWRVTARDVVLVLACLSGLSGLGGYVRMTYEVDALKLSSVSHDQLATSVETNLIGVAVREEQIKNLTEQLRVNNEQLELLRIELKQMRQEWANYRGRR